MRSYDRDNRKGHSAASTTGIALAAGLGGGALLLAIAGIWGVNKASEARSNGALALNAANAAALGKLGELIGIERSSREGWQNSMMPSVQSYIDIRNSNSGSQQTAASAAAEAAAFAQLYANGGLNSAIGTDSFLKVQRYSAPQPCGCDTCGCNG